MRSGSDWWMGGSVGGASVKGWIVTRYRKNVNYCGLGQGELVEAGAVRERKSPYCKLFQSSTLNTIL